MSTITKKAVSAVFALTAMATLTFGGTASAIGEGQIASGDIYRIKNVTKNGAFMDPAYADQCETVQYKVRFHNPGPGIVKNVNVKVNLPNTASTKNVSTVTVTGENAQPATISDTATLNISTAQKVNYINGSAELLDTNGAFLTKVSDTLLSGTGVGIGDVGVSLDQIKFVQFQAKLDCPQPETPAYSCEAFNITADVNRTVKVSTFTTTATNGAVFSKADVNWGDNSSVLTDANIIGKTHQYGKDGTYTITATAHFTVDGKDVTANGPNCVKQVTFKGETPPEVTPPKTPTPPATLVNTGPGEVAGMFAAITGAGAIAHRKYLSRKLARS